MEHKESLIADLSKIDHSLPPGMLRRVSMGTIDVVTHLGKKTSIMAPDELEDEPPKPPPSLKPIPMELGDSLRDIGDPELRVVLESLARSMGEQSAKNKDSQS